MKEGVTSAVIDSEAVAWDRENKVIQPFQVIHSLLFILLLTGRNESIPAGRRVEDTFRHHLGWPVSY